MKVTSNGKNNTKMINRKW